MEDFRESSNITETPHEEKWRDDWLELPQSLNKKKGLEGEDLPHKREDSGTNK